MIIYTAILLGLAGSLHCVGMCGPIALAVPIGSGSFTSKLGGLISYHLARVLAYAIIGLLFGTLGYGFSMTGFQQGISLATGAFILLFLWFPGLSKKIESMGNFSRFQSAVMKKMAALLKSHRSSALLGLGFLNGFLPCGMVYVALAGSMATYHPFEGALFMALFGLGTAPALFIIALSGNRVNQSLRSKMKKAVPIVATVFALLFILRGLGLGIPFISPELGNNVNAAQHCSP